jgi:alpha-1,2-mannosyltransferase
MSASALSRWILAFDRWLTARRVRAQAIMLAVVWWGFCAFDYASPGLFDRAGNLKFQDFIQFPITAQLIAQGRTDQLYNDRALADGIAQIVGHPTTIYLRYFYGPQVALPFVLLRHLSFLEQAEIWVVFSLLIYFACICLLWRTCDGLRDSAGLVALCALAYPSVFHFFVRGQISALPLLFVTLGYLAFRARREWIAGIALGMLAFKPQFLVAIPVVLLLAKAWKPFAGLVVSASAQLALMLAAFGPAVMRAYFRMLLHSAEQPGTTELRLSPIQMHSLRDFWLLLIPWSSRIPTTTVWALYALSSLAVIAMAVAVWRSSSPLALRYPTLLLAAVLVNPHIYIYDLLALAPALLLLADWAIAHASDASARALRTGVYLAFLLPMFGPVARWTHLQLSVVAFAAILWTLFRRRNDVARAPSPAVS